MSFLLQPSSIKPKDGLHNVWRFLLDVLQWTLPVDQKNWLRRLRIASDVKGVIRENCKQACWLFFLLPLDWVSGVWMVVSLLHRESQDDVISRFHFNAPLGIKCMYFKISLITGNLKLTHKKMIFSRFQRTWKFVKYNIFLLKCLFPSFSSATSMLSTTNEILCTSLCVYW